MNYYGKARLLPPVDSRILPVTLLIFGKRDKIQTFKENTVMMNLYKK